MVALCPHSVSLAPTVVRASATAAACATVSRTQSAAFRQLTVSRLPTTEPGAVLTCVGSWVLPPELMLISGAAFSVFTLHVQDTSDSEHLSNSGLMYAFSSRQSTDNVLWRIPGLRCVWLMALHQDT